MSLEQQVIDLTQVTEQLLQAVNTRKIDLNTAETNASLSAQEAQAAANQAADLLEESYEPLTMVQNIAGEAAISAGEAAASASQALAVYGSTEALQTSLQSAQNSARLAEDYAEAASSAVQQDLSGVTAAALHRSPNAVTAMFVYDTSKDSDGGAWTEKCQHTSWYNEPINGKWLGAQASELQARNSGAIVGPELMADTEFDNTASWSKQAGWSVTGGNAVAASVNGAIIYQDGRVSAGKTYQINFTVVSSSGGNNRLRVYAGGTYGDFIVSPAGAYTVYVVAGSSNTWAGISGDATSITISSLSVREVTAQTTQTGDYFQLTTDGKFYRLWKNLLSYSTPQNVSAWTAATSDLGSTTAVTFSSSGAVFDGASSRVSRTIGSMQGYLTTLSFTAKSVSNTTLNISFRNPSSGGTTTITYNPVTKTASITSGSSVNSAIALSVSSDTARIILGIATLSGGNCQITITGGGAGDTLNDFQWEAGTAFTTFESKGAEGSISETFRGNKRDFPRLAGIVAEAASVTIYDLTEPGRPMWMRFVNGGTSWANCNALYQASAINSIFALNGSVCVGASDSGGGGLNELIFTKDIAQKRHSNQIYGGVYSLPIANRNAGNGAMPGMALSGLNAIASHQVNAVAMAVLPDAPVDPVTGLKMPTIAVGAGNSMSIIQSNGTVFNLSGSSGWQHLPMIDRRGSVWEWTTGVTGGWGAREYYGPSYGSNVIYSGYPNQTPNLTNTNSDWQVGKYINADRFLVGNWGSASPNQASLFKPGSPDKSKGLTAFIRNTYNTGWLLSDIRRTYLSDNVVESVDNTNIVVNGDGSDGTTGWVPNPNVSVSNVGGKIRFTATANGAILGGTFSRSKTPLPGSKYLVSGDITRSYTGTTTVYPNFFDSFWSETGDSFSRIITAFTPTVLKINVQSGASILAGDYFEVDNFSAVEVVADRSYKARGASITGTLTKSAVASNAQLVAYSGFSAENYLREPYSADLDFGTGEWSAGAWVNVPTFAGYPVTGAELATNGDFNTDATAWSVAGSNVDISWQSGGTVLVTRLTNSGDGMYQDVLTTAPFVRVDIRARKSSASGTTNLILYRNGSFSTTLVGREITSTDFATYSFTVPTAGTGVRVYMQVVNTGAQIEVDSVSVKEALPAVFVDRSYSTGAKITLGATQESKLTATAFDGTTTRTVTTPAAYNTATWLKADVAYRAGRLALLVNGQEVAVTHGTPLLSLNSRYNLLNYSQQPTSANWTKNGVTITDAAATAPDGTTTASLVTDTTSGWHSTYQGGGVSAGANTFSVYVKAGTHNYISVTMSDGAGWHGITIDATTGQYAAAIGSITSYAITSAGNGWHRVSVTFTHASSINAYPMVGFSNASGSNQGSGGYVGSTANNFYMWGAQIESGSTARAYQRTTTVAETEVAPLTIGNSYATDAPFPGSLAMVKFSATVPTAEQSVWMYEQEKQMFRDGAQCCLPDSGNIVDLSYDDATDAWIAASATNISEWSGLVRTKVTPVPAGSYSKLAASGGVKLAARTTSSPGVDITIPSYLLREELIKKSESAAKLESQIVTFDYVGGFTASTTNGNTAITSVANLTYPTSYIGARVTGSGIPSDTFIAAVSGTTIYLTKAATATATNVQISFSDFILPVGYEAKIVMNNGAIQREGTTQSYTRLFDGFKETIRFAVVPGYQAWVQIQATRSAV